MQNIDVEEHSGNTYVAQKSSIVVLETVCELSPPIVSLHDFLQINHYNIMIMQNASGTLVLSKSTTVWLINCSYIEKCDHVNAHCSVPSDSLSASPSIATRQFSVF